MRLSRHYLSFYILISVMFACFMTVAPAAAQGNSSGSGQASGDDSQFVRKELERPATLPYFPEPPPGSKFVGGNVSEKFRGGPAFVQSYICPTGERETLNYYVTQLPSLGWKAPQSYESCIDVRHKEGHNCIVSVQPNPDKQFRSRVIIYFHRFEKR